jgi:hypothetical protein
VTSRLSIKSLLVLCVLLSGCAASSGSSLNGKPATPQITAQSVKGGIVVRYEIAPSEPPVYTLLLTVNAKNKLDAVRSDEIHSPPSQGKATLPLPLGAGPPYLAAASTFSFRGERSKTVVVGVKP